MDHFRNGSMCSLCYFRKIRNSIKRIQKLYPEEPLFAAGLRADGPMVSYGEDFESATLAKLVAMIQKRVPREKLFMC